MRLKSGLVGFCTLALATQALIGCGDDEAKPFNPVTAGNTSTAGMGPGGSSSGGSSAGSESTAGNGGTFSQAGSATGGSATGGSATGGSAGTAGTGGTGPLPACTADATCADTDVCTDDKCVDGECVHTDNTATCDDGNVCTSEDKCAAGECKGTNNTANCDDLSSCTAGQDKCAAGKCGGTRDEVLCPACDVEGNLIQNCDFTDGLMHWAEAITFGGNATQTVINEVDVIDVLAGGTQVYAVQPRQEPLTLKQGMKYKLRMLAGSSVNRKITVSLTKGVAPYAIYSDGGAAGGGYEFDLTKDMKPFEREFVMPGNITTEVPTPTGDDNQVKLEIKVGGEAGNPSKVYFDDVYLVEQKCDANPFCDDGNSCTTDVCDVAKGTCSWTTLADDAACESDNESCTADTCQLGVCEHTALDDGDDCDDEGDDCTADTCSAGQCKHKYDTNVCDCVLDAHCDDGELCTTDVCKDDGTCAVVPNTLACDDANACTSTDKCAAGVCGGTPNTNPCDDGNACTSTDVCAAGECGGTDNTAVCDDGNVCTVSNMCAAGACGVGTNKCFDCTAGGNILVNCAFANGLASWATDILFGGTATQTVEAGLLKVVTTASGNDPYMVQPRQGGITLLPNTHYVVRYNAFASVARPIVVSVSQNGPAVYDSVSGPQIANLTVDMNEYTFMFDTGATVPATIKIEFDLGGTANNAVLPNTVYIDNVSLVGTPIP